MQKIKGLLILILLITLSFTVSAQEYSTKNKKAIKLYEESEGYLRLRKFDIAVSMLKEALDKAPDFAEAHLKLGNIYKTLASTDEAKRHIYRGVELKPNDRRFYASYFLAGEYYFGEAKYADAKKYFEMVLSLNPNDRNLPELSKKYIEKADFSIELMKTPLSINPVKMSSTINKYYIHAYPVLTADLQSIMFCKKSGPRPTDDEDIVISRKVNGEWTEPVSLSDNINTELNEGAATLSADGMVMVFTSCNRKDGLGSCDLYISYKEGTNWTKPVNLGKNVNSNVWDSEPAISADGRTIYFSSERRGGLGKEDIWFTNQDDKGEWSVAKNLGQPVNTEGREVSPFIHANGKTLYFSSSTHLGLGGLDMFSAKLNADSTWTKPKNLGYPLNGPSNDATIYITPDGKKGYYTVYDKKDMKASAYLYEFDVPEQIRETEVSTYAKGRVFDAVTKAPLEASVELMDINIQKKVQAVSSDKVNGEYLIILTKGSEYGLYVNKEGYLMKSVYFNNKDSKSDEPVVLDIYLDPIKTGAATVLNNIFFRSGSADLEEKSKTELDRISSFLKVNSKVQIEFGGHTDDVGSDKDNMLLSERRAKAVFDYLVKAGLPAARLKYKGYGETKPLAPNTSENNRQQNRRIEFKIL